MRRERDSPKGIPSEEPSGDHQTSTGFPSRDDASLLQVSVAFHALEKPFPPHCLRPAGKPLVVVQLPRPPPFGVPDPPRIVLLETVVQVHRTPVVVCPVRLRPQYICIIHAEREGFEPPETIRPQRFSRPPHSTTLPSLRLNQNFKINFNPYCML